MSTTEAAIFERLIEPGEEKLPPEVAHFLLTRNFPPQDRLRMEELVAKELAGTLTPTERAELESYRRIGQLLDRMQARARQALEGGAPIPPEGEPSQLSFEIPPGIKHSQEAFWRDLPELLRKKGNHGQWVAYHGDEQIGIARTQTELLRECLRRGLNDDQYCIALIRPRELPPWEPEEVEPIHPTHFEDFPSDS